MSGKGLVPKLRFPEFREAAVWDTQALSSVADFISERVPLSTLELASYVSTETILPDFGGIGSTTALPTSGSFTRYSPGDVLIANIRPYLKKVWQADRAGAASNDVIVVRSKPSIRPDYTASLLRSDQFIDYIMRGAKGVKMPRGDVALMKAYPVPLPGHAEQRKIAKCLTSLDELIAAEGRRLEALRKWKKALLQNLFPTSSGSEKSEGRSEKTADGEPFSLPNSQFSPLIPRLRFPEFRNAGEWKDKALRKVCSINPSAIGLPESFIYIDLESVVAGELIKRNRTPREGAPSRAQRLLQAEDVIFQIVRPYQRNNLFVDFEDGGPYVASTGYAQLRAFGSKPFLFQAVHHDSFVDKVIAKCTGSNYPAINSSDLAEIPLPMPPTEAEQHRIASCLGSLDTLIAEQAKKLATLKTHKQGLMQGLFPSEK